MSSITITDSKAVFNALTKYIYIELDLCVCAYVCHVIAYALPLKLEDRGAQAPLILAPAEGFRGFSAPFGGLWPLLWGLWPLLEAYGLS